MVKISRLRLKNFKSFRKAFIPFNKGFTAIAGSNGSGKSNIMDAIMFVFGSTSLKTLRASRLKELVNNSAEDGYANVEAELAGQDKNYLLSRSIDGEGKSVYRLDGKRVAMNEATALLTELGVRADGYNIVMQGDVTKIIEMSELQRREIIDDLAGLKEFDEKKGEALKELEKVDRKIREVEIVLKERGAYLEQLEQEKEAAIEFRGLEKELLQSKASIIFKEAKKVEEAQAEGEKIMREGEESKARKEQKKLSLLKELEEKKAKANALNRQILEESEKAYSGTGIEAEEAKAKKQVAEERAHSLREQAAQARERIRRLKERAQTASELTEKKKALAGGNKKRITELNALLAEKESLLKESGEKKEKALERLNEKEKKAKDVLEEKESLSEKLFELGVEEAKAKKELESLEERLNDLKEGEEFRKAESTRLLLKNLEKKNEKIRAKAREALKLAEKEELKKSLYGIMEDNAETGKILKEMKKFFGTESMKEKMESLSLQKNRKEKALEEALPEKARLQELLENAKQTSFSLQKEIKTLGSAAFKESGLEKEAFELKRELAGIEAENREIGSFLSETKTEKETLEEINEIEKEIKEKELLAEKEEKKAKDLGQEVKELEFELEKASKSTDKLKFSLEKLNEALEKTEEQREKLEIEINRLEKQQNDLKVEQGKNEVRLSDLKEEMKEFEEVKILEEKGLEELKKRVSEIDSRIKELGAINMKAIESFDGLAKEMLETKRKAEQLEKERLAVLELMDKIEFKRTKVFMECFNEINSNFNKMYNSLAEGQGKLTLSEPENPLESGLIIEAKHFGDKLKTLDSMSGGEKTLTALAFLFAIQLYRPAPFYFFDEADAALDKENSIKLARIIREISRKSQFIAITHNEPLIKESDQIIGVTLNKDKSSVIGLKLKEEIEKPGEVKAKA